MQFRKLLKHLWLQPLFVYLLLTVVVALIFIWRFPNNVTHPNFYAEDGSVFLQNIIDKGWLSAALTPFNGYSIVGLYAIEAFAWLMNALFGDGLLTLPIYFALSSIIFMAAVISLPYLLFSKLFGRINMLAVVICGVLLPLPVSPHIVIGTVGNQKWLFFYLAFLLVLYRLFNYKNLSLKKVIAIDIILLICAYTNSTTYVLIPLLFFPFLRAALGKRSKKVSLVKSIILQARHKEFLSLLVLCSLLLPQIIYVALNGIPATPGYLDTPYQFSKTIEVFINRTYIFGVTHIVNGVLNNWLVIMLFGVMAGLCLALLRGYQRLAFFMAIYASFMATTLFVVNRTGVTDFFLLYKAGGSGPDQFFYAQTLIMYLPLVLVAFALSKWLGRWGLERITLISFMLLIIVSGLLSNSWYGGRWRNASVFENSVNTFVDQSLISCKTQKNKIVRITVYPYENGQFSVNVPRNQVCTNDLKNYQLSFKSFGLSPDNNNFLTIESKDTFRQTFNAKQNNLNGIRIFLSVFGKERRQGYYVLQVSDVRCSEVVRTVNIPSTLLDNAYYNARFTPLHDSAGRDYCLRLLPDNQVKDDLIAVQLSKPNEYLEGKLLQNNKASSSDIVFQLLYTQSKE